MMCLGTSVQKALCFLMFLSYITVQPLFIYRVYSWFAQGELEVFLTLLVLLVAPMLVVNLISAILLLRSRDLTGSSFIQTLCVLSHCLQLGILWRLSSIFHSFDERKMLGFSILTVGQSATSLLPALLLEGVLLKPMLPTVAVTSQAFLAVGVISSALSFVLAQKSIRQKRHSSDALNNSKIILLSVSHMFGVTCLLASRCLSIVLFTYVLTYWITLLLGLHLLLCFTVSLLYIHFQLKKVNFLCVLKQSGLMYLYVFDSVTTGSGPGKCANVLYYTLVLVENILMTAVWVMTSAHSDITKLITVMIMLSSFVIGVVLKFLCHSCTDGDMEEDSDLKTLQVRAASSTSINQRSSSRDLRAISARSASVIEDNQAVSEINSTSATVCAKVSKRTHQVNPITVSRSSRASSQGQSSASYHNRAFDGADNVNEKNPKRNVQKKSAKEKMYSRSTQDEAKTTSDTSDHGRSLSSKAKQNRTMLKSQRGYCSEEYTDIGSSNSRNTNTLDLSGQSNPVGNNSSCDRVEKTGQKTPTIQHNQNDLPECDRNPRTVANRSNPSKHDQCRPKSCAPFVSSANKPYPNDWYNYWANHWQHQEPQRAIDQYSCDLYTDTTSYYDTLSYYYTVTSSHTSSEDSDCARTWPPSVPTGLQGHHTELPDEKVSPEERISQWLHKSRQYFSQDFLRYSKPQDSRFGSNRRTICGYTNKVSVSSTSSKRLPPRGIKNRQRQQLSADHCEENRIQFQTYMDSLKTKKKPSGVWALRPKISTRKNSAENEPKDLTKSISDDTPQTDDSRVKPPRPPRPPRPQRDIKITYTGNVKNNSTPLVSSHNDRDPFPRNETMYLPDQFKSSKAVSPPYRNEPKSTVANSHVYSRKPSSPSAPMLSYGNEQSVNYQAPYSEIATLRESSQKPSPLLQQRMDNNHQPNFLTQGEPNYSQKQLSVIVPSAGYIHEEADTSHSPKSNPAWTPNTVKSCPSPSVQRASYSPEQQIRPPPPYFSTSSPPVRTATNYSNKTFCESKSSIYSDSNPPEGALWASYRHDQTPKTDKIPVYSHNGSQPVVNRGNHPHSPVMKHTIFTQPDGKFPSHGIIPSPRIGRAIYSPHSISPPLNRPHSMSSPKGNYLQAPPRTSMKPNVPPYRPRQSVGSTCSNTKDIPRTKPDSGLESAV